MVGGMGSTPVPAFAVERQAGLRDFWAVYLPVIGHVRETAMETALRRAELPTISRVRVADELAAHARQCNALLGDAIVTGEWQPYVDEIRSFGARCAALGVKFASWNTATEAFRQRLIPALVEAY